MTIYELMAKWRQPIADWAISKGWMNPDVPRSMLELLFLVGTEYEEMLDGVEVGDWDNAIEELADVAIRVIQLQAEWNLPGLAKGCSDDAAPHRASRHTIGAAFAAAGELFRDKNRSSYWQILSYRVTMILNHAFAELATVSPYAITVEALDLAIDAKMVKNAARPPRHDKMA